MKIDFEGVTRVLDLEHIKLKHAVAVQEFTGLPLMDWTRSLITRDVVTPEDARDPARAMEKMTMLTDPGWITNMAAAHWLMLTQAAEDPPPLDEDYDCEVLSFGVALYTAAVEEVKAKHVPDKPGPTARPGRSAPSSRRTKPPASKPPMTSPPPPTGS